MAFTMIPLKNEDENFSGAQMSSSKQGSGFEAGSGFQTLTFNAFGNEDYPSTVVGFTTLGNGTGTASVSVDSGLSVTYTVREMLEMQDPARPNAQVTAVVMSDGNVMYTKSYFLREYDAFGGWVDTPETGIYVGAGFSISLPNRMNGPYLATFQQSDVHTLKIKASISLAPDGSAQVNATAKVDFPEQNKAGSFTTRELNAIDAAMREHEGITDHMYLDTNGNVTVGVGFMLPNESAAAEYPFLNSNNSPASVEQKRAEWQTIHALPTNYVADWYQSHTELHLASEYIDSKLGAIVSTNFSELSNLFPAIGQYPGAARVALQDMIYNVGATRLPLRFPRLMEAVRNQDWVTAATESHRNIPDESRNEAVRDLFLNAAGNGDF
ncbi:hypothetical protein [Pseudomonas monteilii]|uniref:hypothetical protein n=1 Tax=Pseudomonas monteilii TaxID=76759 RepID=UPI003905851E